MLTRTVTTKAEEETRRAKEGFLSEVGNTRQPATQVMKRVHEHNPDISVERVRSALWELVGSRQIVLGWDGDLERGE